MLGRRLALRELTRLGGQSCIFCIFVGARCCRPALRAHFYGMSSLAHQYHGRFNAPFWRTFAHNTQPPQKRDGCEKILFCSPYYGVDLTTIG